MACGHSGCEQKSLHQSNDLARQPNSLSYQRTKQLCCHLQQLRIHRHPARLPAKSDDTASLLSLKSKTCCKSPRVARSRKKLLISSFVVSRPRFHTIIAIETSGVGTRMAFAVNFPFKCGRHLIVAFAAPVSVNTRFSGAERPRLVFLCMLSIKFWSFVNA